MKILLFILLAFLPIGDSLLKGKVVKVADGDTITILTEKNEQIRVRLDGIDCPEKNQAFGQKAKELTARLCAGKQVQVKYRSKDRYGRVLGYVIVDGVDVNKELLKAGLAWHYKHFNKDKELAELEAKAKATKIGLWADKKPIAPWDFRRMKKTNKISR